MRMQSLACAHSNRPAAEATASKTCCVKTASPWSVHLLPFARRQLRKLDLDVRSELLISSREYTGNVEIGLTPDCTCATSCGGVRLGHAAVAVADFPGWYDSHYGRAGF